MKIKREFLKQISKNGLYIILFLCLVAVGVAGYVMYRVQPSEAQLIEPEINPVSDEFEIIELPEPKIEEQVVANEPEPKIEAEIQDEPVIAKSETIEVDEGPTEFVTAVNGKIEVPFSGDELIKSKTFGDWRTHAGIDIAAEQGSKVCAIANGKVKDVFEDQMMGHTVVIEHKDGIISTYCNLMEGIIVKKGQSVKAGDVIGGVGTSAIAECLEVSHLHLEVTKDGVAIDPMSLIE